MARLGAGIREKEGIDLGNGLFCHFSYHMHTLDKPSKREEQVMSFFPPSIPGSGLD